MSIKFVSLKELKEVLTPTEFESKLNEMLSIEHSVFINENKVSQTYSTGEVIEMIAKRTIEVYLESLKFDKTVNYHKSNGFIIEKELKHTYRMKKRLS